MTKTEAKKYFSSLNKYFSKYYDYMVSADGIYLSDGVYVTPLEYAVMQGDMTDEQENIFNQAVEVLYPESKEYEYD